MWWKFFNSKLFNASSEVSRVYIDLIFHGCQVRRDVNFRVVSQRLSNVCQIFCGRVIDSLEDFIVVVCIITLKAFELTIEMGVLRNVIFIVELFQLVRSSYLVATSQIKIKSRKGLLYTALSQTKLFGSLYFFIEVRLPFQNFKYEARISPLNYRITSSRLGTT